MKCYFAISLVSFIIEWPSQSHLARIQQIWRYPITDHPVGSAVVNLPMKCHFTTLCLDHTKILYDLISDINTLVYSATKPVGFPSDIRHWFSDLYDSAVSNQPLLDRTVRLRALLLHGKTLSPLRHPSTAKMCCSSMVSALGLQPQELGLEPRS